MTRCDYCGKENEETAEACRECGTPIRRVEAASGIPPVIEPPALNALRATIIFVLTFAAQTIGATIVTIVLMLAAHGAGHDLRDPNQVRQLTTTIQPVAIIAACLVGIGMTLAAPLLLVRRELTDRSPTGAAWALGAPKDLAKGLGLGLIIAVGYLILLAPAAKHLTEKDLGPLSTMAVTKGFPQMAWIVVAVLLVPGPEELLFRGVMYGGYRRSFGPTIAAVLTTTIFVLLHITEWSHFPPAALAITGLALATLFMRLRSGAIGPAIALHLMYNSVIAINSVLYTALKAA